MAPQRFIIGLLLLYETLFLNVFLPGHTRGAVTLDGKHSTAPICCCCGDAPKPADTHPAGPSQRDRDNCAVCQFAAGLTTAVPIDLKLPPLGLLDLLPIEQRPSTVSLRFTPTYLACGPPASEPQA